MKPVTKQAPLSSLNCQLSSGPVTVGEKLSLDCNVSESVLNSLALDQVRLEQRGAEPPHAIEALGPAQREGLLLKIPVTGYKVGNFEFKDLVLKLGDESYQVSPVKLSVQSVIQQEQAQQQPTPYPNYTPSALWAPLWWWIFWGVIFLSLIGISLWQILKWKKNKEALAERARANRPLTGREKFQKRMRKLESQNFHMVGQFKNFALELSQILKSGISDALEFSAEDMTTDELFQALQARYRATWNATEKDLKPLLKELDQIKFAKKLPTSDDCRGFLDRAYVIGKVLFGGTP